MPAWIENTVPNKGVLIPIRKSIYLCKLPFIIISASPNLSTLFMLGYSLNIQIKRFIDFFEVAQRIFLIGFSRYRTILQTLIRYLEGDIRLDSELRKFLSFTVSFSSCYWCIEQICSMTSGFLISRKRKVARYRVVAVTLQNANIIYWLNTIGRNPEFHSEDFVYM